MVSKIDAGREFTDPSVFEGIRQGAHWADPVMDPREIDWSARQASAAIPFEVIDGRPVNPCESTGIRYGRNEFGHWGEAQMADALVTCVYKGTRYLLMIERRDGHGWAVPGGHVESGETGMRAAVRELEEETGLVTRLECETADISEMPVRYVPDPRASDEAWAVTTPVHIDLGVTAALPSVLGGDDAASAEWINATSYDHLRSWLASYFEADVFAAHTAMLGDFLGPDEPAPAIVACEVPDCLGCREYDREDGR
jgi:8-oxo-dGTP pyrophosphatase MutT (NUDIX family)